jgi:hypothetical protein
MYIPPGWSCTAGKELVMSEEIEMAVEKPRRDSVKVALIVVAGACILGCILAAAAVMIVFFMNAPW